MTLTWDASPAASGSPAFPATALPSSSARSSSLHQHKRQHSSCAIAQLFTRRGVVLGRSWNRLRTQLGRWSVHVAAVHGDPMSTQHQPTKPSCAAFIISQLNLSCVLKKNFENSSLTCCSPAMPAAWPIQRAKWQIGFSGFAFLWESGRGSW